MDVIRNAGGKRLKPMTKEWNEWGIIQWFKKESRKFGSFKHDPKLYPVPYKESTNDRKE